MKFRKITAMAGSLLMAGLTVTTAAAAAFPAPFVQNGVADVAVVYGASSLDQAAATNVQTALSTYATSGTVSVDGGETFALERSSSKFALGDNLNTAYTTLGDEELDFLADGTYRDGGINTDYSQKITLGSSTALSYFKDSSYNDNEPTVGFNFASNANILNYTITFDDAVNASLMEGTDLPLLGRDYYVKSVNSNEIVLLDSAEKVTISRDETITVNGKSVTLEFLGTNGARFVVDGESVRSLTANQDYELRDGSWLVVTDLLTSAKESVEDKVEFSIGKGKITLRDGSEVVMGDETIRGLKSHIDSTSEVKEITLQWDSYRKTFLGEGDSIMMPGFENLGVVFGGLDYPTDSELISLQNGETMILAMENYDLPLAWINSNGDVSLGEDGYPLILADANYLFANETHEFTATGTLDDGNITMTGGLAVEEGDRFIVTNMDTYLSDVTTLYYEVDRIVYTSSSDFEVVLRDQIGNSDLTFTSLRGRDRGDVTVTLGAVGENSTSQEGIAYLTFTSGVDFDKVVSEKGLVVDLSAFDVDTTMVINFTEANDKDQIEAGESFTVTVGSNTDEDRLHVNATSVNTLAGASNRDLYTGVVASNLATQVTWDKSGNENDFEIVYYGEEAIADVQVVVGGEVTIGDSLGNVMITANEAASSNASNLVIVGGSCINSAAATVLGGAYCGAAFTDATGVGVNEFLIRGFEDSAIGGKFALLVAGYEAADTTNAVTYLVNKRPDTSKTWVGTTATADATEVTETA